MATSFDASSRPPERLEQRIRIAPDGSVLARSGKVEIGQGIRTGFAMIVAEELRLAPDRVCMELGETDEVPWDMGTVGSMSTAIDGARLRAAATLAREQLMERASILLAVPVSQLRLDDGQVVAPDGRACSFADLVAKQPLSGPITADPPVLDAPQFPDRPSRVEAHAIVTGAGRYVADIRLPGLLRGAVVHPRGTRQRLVRAGIERARAMPGVVAVVAEDGFCGVVTERDDQLFPALHALEVEWTEQPPSQEPPYAAILRRDSDDSAVWEGAAIRLAAQYHAPHIAHGSILPRAAVADVRQDEAHLYVATQRPFGLRDRVAALLGLAIDRVHVHPQLASGMYGRGNIEDASIEAVRLSRAAGRPVLVEWSRGEEFRLSRHRPKFDADVAAALDRNGRLVAWRYHARTNPHLYTVEPPHPGMHEMSAGRNALPPYALGCADIRLTVEQADVPTAAFRSLGASLNVFAIESFIDELAEAAREDPIAFRLAHIDDPRLARVLEVVRERSGWARQRPAGIGLGVACAIYHGTYIAQVAEVAMRAGRPVLERAWCAVDAGRMVHVDGARNQIEGGIQQAASWTLLEELRQEAGVVQSASWRDYPIARCHDAPREIDVVFVGAPGQPSTGVGEPGSVPTAAAIANAIRRACGRRVRTLPIRITKQEDDDVG